MLPPLIPLNGVNNLSATCKLHKLDYWLLTESCMNMREKRGVLNTLILCD